MADRAGVTSQALMRAEQGVYSSPSPSILDALWGEADANDPAVSDLYDYGVLLADYHNFQKLTRQDNYGSLEEPFTFLNTGEHPFVDWRLRSGITARIQISKRFCVHPALIFKFEMQPYLCTTIPKELVRALLGSGYTEDTMKDLADAYAMYKDSRSLVSVGTATFKDADDD
jgi:hypothetical protein